jgi:hypothetical protein
MNLGFSSESSQDFNVKLVKMGIVIGNGDEIQQYWKLSMDLLEIELKNVYNSLIESLKQQGMGTMTEDDYNKRFEQFKDSVSKISWSDSDMTISPTQFYNKFLANSVNVRSFRVTSWRDLFEHIGASTQCSVAQKNINEVISWNICYICGTEIIDKFSKPEPPWKHDTRECEHILPAFTSLGYKGLIQSSKMPETTDDTLLEYFRYEYANAHKCCNQIKTDDKWIKYDKTQKTYVIDQNALGSTLTNILTSPQYDCREITKDSRTFVSTRGSEIMRLYLNPIVAIINTEKKDYGDLFDLKIRINQLSALKLNINQIAYAIMTGMVPPPPQKISKMYNITYAKFLSKKQFSNPENLFFDVFKNIFSTSDLNLVEQMFSSWFAQPLRKLVRISRKIFELGMQKINPANKSFSIISAEIMYKSYTDIDQLFDESGTEEIEESILIPFNNQNIINLKIEFRRNLLYIVNNIISTMETARPDLSGLFNMLKQQIKESADTDQAEDEINKAVNKTETTTQLRLQQGGASNKLKKKSHIYKKMVGGSSKDFEDSYKNDILEIADNLGFDPARYGIRVTTTRSGRSSIPRLPTVYVAPGTPAIQIGTSYYVNNPSNPNAITNFHPPYDTIAITNEGQRRGIRDNAGNFYPIGGRKKKLYKKTKKSKNVYHKKYTIKNNKGKNNKGKNNKGKNNKGKNNKGKNNK